MFICLNLEFAWRLYLMSNKWMLSNYLMDSGGGGGGGLKFFYISKPLKDIVFSGDVPNI